MFEFTYQSRAFVPLVIGVAQKSAQGNLLSLALNPKPLNPKLPGSAVVGSCAMRPMPLLPCLAGAIG